MQRTVGLLVVAATLTLLGGTPAVAQFMPFGSGTQFELTDTVQVDRADPGSLANLERVKAYLANQQWDEAVETLRQLSETAENRLIGVTDRRFVSLRDYCQLQLAALPPEALALYHSRVDGLARGWYDEGMSQRNPRLLMNVVDQAFASSWGDDALRALGEWAFERGDFTAARWWWERILPVKLPDGAPATWPGYPDTSLDVAAIRARLVLVSIVEGSFDRARGELDQFRRLHTDARGRLGGLDVNFADALTALLAEAVAWPVATPAADWPTFAGAQNRNHRAASAPDPAGVAWRRTWPLSAAPPAPARATTEESRPNSFPIVVGGMLLANDPWRIIALAASDGRPVWGAPEGDGAIYRDQFDGLGPGALGASEIVGAPRFTLTAHNQRLYARMGPPISGRPLDRPSQIGNGYLVCLDLAAQGRLQWKVQPDDGWAFEGSPVVDEGNVFVAMRRNDVRPQAHVACFEAETGRQRWRHFIAAAETPARGMLHESSHSLLTLEQGMLYFNTNLGAVAALRAADGQVQWVSLYPRALKGDVSRPARHTRREPAPCLFDRGVVYVAPADSPRIFAFDAAGGQLLWQTSAELEDATHLLGVAGDWLIAGGGRLYWISTCGDDQGQASHFWPDGAVRIGFGRGLLAGDSVYWPAREAIYVFDAQSARQRRVIDLKPRNTGGGNLLVADGRLFIATPTELVALGNEPAAPPAEARPLTMRDMPPGHE